jgi:hypothetical protein
MAAKHNRCADGCSHQPICCTLNTALTTAVLSFNKLEEVKSMGYLLIAALEHLDLNFGSSFKVIGSSLTSN